MYEVFKEVNFLRENVLVNLLKHFLKSIFGINKFYPSLTGKVFKIYKWEKNLQKTFYYFPYLLFDADCQFIQNSWTTFGLYF